MNIGIIGLGYVGLPLAAALSKKHTVYGMDINANRIARLKQFKDDTQELTSDQLKKVVGVGLHLTTEIESLADCSVFIITVPTPVTKNNIPDLSPVIKATEAVAGIVKEGDIIVYESTVYPGVTEDICAPLLESKSNLKFNKDFFLGYSPERINPGDKEHTITKIKKVVSGSTPECLKALSQLYGSIIEAGIYEAPNIKTAEAAKVIENTQRDINIAFVNELAMIFGKMGIDTNEVLKAAGTKWNFLKFFPGLVGGHCIGVDPYYLAFKSQEIGHNPEMILAGRRINDHIPVYIVNRIIKQFHQTGRKFDAARALILGATFKEDCPDIRNSKVVNIFKELQDFGVASTIHDPIAASLELKDVYGKENVITSLTTETKYDIIILAVSHNEFKNIDITQISKPNAIIFDVKGFYPQEKGYLRL
jgi:UDP-N-acetyl-D-glucosamine/UDP-N-acetyl-D-galactosamine dehydrogenase